MSRFLQVSVLCSEFKDRCAHLQDKLHVHRLRWSTTKDNTARVEVLIQDNQEFIDMDVELGLSYSMVSEIVHEKLQYRKEYLR